MFLLLEQCFCPPRPTERKTPVRGSVSVLPPVLGDSVCLCAPWRVCRCRCTPPPPLDGLERGVPRYNTRDSAPLPSGFSHVGSAASTPTSPRRFNVCPLTSASCCERSNTSQHPKVDSFLNPQPPLTWPRSPRTAKGVRQDTQD